MINAQYKPLGLTQVCEIREVVEERSRLYPDYTIVDNAPIIVARIVERFPGYDPADVRQAAEEALENLRKY